MNVYHDMRPFLAQMAARELRQLGWRARVTTHGATANLATDAPDVVAYLASPVSLPIANRPGYVQVVGGPQ